MIEIVLFTIVLIAAFVAVGWYAHRKSQQQIDAFLDDGKPVNPAVSDSGFGKVFNQQLQEQSGIKPNSESTVSLSTQIPKSFKNDDIEPKQTSLKSKPKQTVAEVESLPQRNEVLEGEMVIAFTIIAANNLRFSGDTIKSALKSVDMDFGKLDIYHRYTSDTQKKTLFSVANLLEPGSLSPSALFGLMTPGLLLFARLPGPVNGLTLFDELLITAEKLTQKLGGTLCDEQQQPINQAALESIRTRILNFNMALQLEQHQYDH